jgi:alpha-D-xyloside xylohydrolase
MLDASPPAHAPLASHTHTTGDLREIPAAEIRTTEIRTTQGAGGGVEWTGGQETLRIEAWGPDALRVRSKLGGAILEGLPGALLDGPVPGPPPRISLDAHGARIVHGAITATVTVTGRITFTRTADGAELLAEQDAHFWWPGPRLRTAHGNGYHRIEQRFRAYPGEKLYGLGQHAHGLYDQKGAVVELVQRNGEITIPVLVSSRGYGLLWNSPAIGRVELALNGTRWVADSARQLDYWVTAGAPAQILRAYADATGHAPMLPRWAAGFWQCKLRYRSQEELLEVAREYHRRGVPLEVITCDFFHWTHLGDWRFDPAEWPDPAAAVRELASYGTKLMVSVWPSVSPLSENHAELERRGLFVGTEFGPVAHADWPDKGIDKTVQVAFYDATNPEAREFVWSRVRENYLSLGIEVFWADACEPELKPGYPANLRYHAGPGLEVGNLYPRENSRAFYEGLHAEGRTEVVTLNRSAWAGSQRYGAAVWSGDIHADFATFRQQIGAGLNMALSGIPWWNTDIGGFHGGDPDDPAYRELMVRWFQFGALSPIFRLHGFREPAMELGPEMTGGPNEIWSYGPEAYRILAGYIRLRARLKPYILEVMREAHVSGLPPMRPCFVEFPADPRAWDVAEAYLFGPDLLVAPVLEADARQWTVYLPAGAHWTDAWTGAGYEGGRSVTVDAPLDRLPLFLRDGADLPIRAADNSAARDGDAARDAACATAL